MQTFDLMCLYTNSARVREGQRGQERLRVGSNKLLVERNEEGGSSSGLRLHENVLKLLPTAQALLFAVDATDVLGDADAGEAERASRLDACRVELAMMVEGLDPRDRHTPVLVLSCRWRRRKEGEAAYGVRYFAQHLGLTGGLNRPWAIFDVDIEDMEGMATALDWVLYHCQKRRNNLLYHKNQSVKLL